MRARRRRTRCLVHHCLVQARLLAGQRGVVDALDLVRQVVDDVGVGLEPAQQEGRHPQPQAPRHLFVAEGVATYPDGGVYHVAMIMHFEGGEVRRETWYFGEPFEAPEWREPFTD